MKVLYRCVSVSCFLAWALFAIACNEQGQGEGRVANPLNPQQVSRAFFEAYRDFDKAAAERVSNREVVDLLDWDRSVPRGRNLQLQGEAIIDGNKVIQLEILSDGHVGSNVSGIRMDES